MALHVASGKVREIYAVDLHSLLIVATDRISAYDVVLPDPIPDKGKILTGLTVHWLEVLGVPSHFLTTDLDGVDLEGVPDLDLVGRSMLVRRAEVIPIECVVRGYLYGSAWREYAQGGGPATEHLPKGLVLADPLPEPVFTPSSKAAHGHDQNLTEAEARKTVGDDLYETMRERSISTYRIAAEHAAERGLLLADTKFEFGFADDELLLVDEVLTPDSSRYWPAEAWQPQIDVPSFDKQYVRAWLDQIGWDRKPPGPSLPSEVVAETRIRYVEAYRRICGREFEARP
ncbi:MAG TPA: phosphoribosylaminoimidazolesuccinocarboxamide synthase [Acidimicrobiia bacterium]